MTDVAALHDIFTRWRSHGCELRILHGYLLCAMGTVLVDEHTALRFMRHGRLVRVLPALTSARVPTVGHALSLPRLNLDLWGMIALTVRLS